MSRGLLSDVSSIFLSDSFCTRSLMREKTAKSFIRGRKQIQNIFNRIFVGFFKVNLRFSLYIDFDYLYNNCVFHFFQNKNEVWKVMEMCYQILLLEKRVTQRELFYKLLCDSPDYFPSQLFVNRTIQGYTHFS